MARTHGVNPLGHPRSAPRLERVARSIDALCQRTEAEVRGQAIGSRDVARRVSRREQAPGRSQVRGRVQPLVDRARVGTDGGSSRCPRPKFATSGEREIEIRLPQLEAGRHGVTLPVMETAR
jgi:hypothetical protein